MLSTLWGEIADLAASRKDRDLFQSRHPLDLALAPLFARGAEGNGAGGHPVPVQGEDLESILPDFPLILQALSRGDFVGSAEGALFSPHSIRSRIDGLSCQILCCPVAQSWDDPAVSIFFHLQQGTQIRSLSLHSRYFNAREQTAFLAVHFLSYQGRLGAMELFQDPGRFSTPLSLTKDTVDTMLGLLRDGVALPEPPAPSFMLA